MNMIGGRSILGSKSEVIKYCKRIFILQRNDLLRGVSEKKLVEVLSVLLRAQADLDLQEIDDITGADNILDDVVHEAAIEVVVGNDWRATAIELIALLDKGA
jgi:hypothetical protein